jgi:glycosyltransferase involved in cell wall biosynthesis
MRHLHFTQSLEPLQGGGLGSSTLSLHRQLIAAGEESTLCSTHGECPRYSDNRVLEFSRIKPDFLFYAPGLHYHARRLVKDTDIVHGHGFYVGTNYFFGGAARRQAKPLVYHVHGIFEPWILRRSRWKKRLVHWLFEDANFRHVRLWRALTSKEADQIRACGIDGPIVVTPHGLNTADFGSPPDPTAPIETPVVERLCKSRNRVLFMGRLHPKKGLDLLVPAWAKMGTLLKDWELVIAGPDEAGYLQELEALIRSSDAADQIIVTGPVQGMSKTALLHSADVFVLPSYSEGFPMSLLEALACGVPVVATDACNFPEISTAAAGWVCRAELGSLTQALRTVLQTTGAERKELGRNGRTLIETRYAWPKILPQLLQACAALC